MNEVPSPRFGVKLALDWKKRFLSSEPYFDAVDETFDELAKKLNSDKQLVKTISDLKPSLLEMSYVGSDKGGPGVYGAPEITFRKPTMSIELRFTISRLMNVRNIFLSGLNIIKQVEGRVLEELEPNQ